jgi:hypothetical protein
MEREVGLCPETPCSSAVEKREIRLVARDSTETVIASFVGRVVARPTKNDAVIYRCGSAELDVLRMVRLGAFPKFVASGSSVPKTEYLGSTTRATVLLAQ